MSDIVETRSDRPDQPWRLSWPIGTGPITIFDVSAAQALQWSCCITSVHVARSGSNQGGDANPSYFEMVLTDQRGAGTQLLGVVISSGTTLPIVFPTPLVVDSPSAWSLRVFWDSFLGGALTLNVVGFWARLNLPTSLRRDFRSGGQTDIGDVPPPSLASRPEKE
ncbi:MAG TPA: hypothetical protein VFW21_15505 [Mycobacterium sp.]|nr:hypothetical protein [Mycobacterium sp.]